MLGSKVESPVRFDSTLKNVVRGPPGSQFYGGKYIYLPKVHQVVKIEVVIDHWSIYIFTQGSPGCQH